MSTKVKGNQNFIWMCQILRKPSTKNFEVSRMTSIIRLLETSTFQSEEQFDIGKFPLSGKRRPMKILNRSRNHKTLK